MDRADLHFRERVQQPLKHRLTAWLLLSFERIPYPLIHTGFHFGSSFPGKGDKNDLTRRYAQLLIAEHIESTFYRQVRFPGTRTGRYQEVFIKIMFAEALPIEAILFQQIHSRHG